MPSVLGQRTTCLEHINATRGTRALTPARHPQGIEPLTVKSEKRRWIRTIEQRREGDVRAMRDTRLAITGVR